MIKITERGNESWPQIQFNNLMGLVLICENYKIVNYNLYSSSIKLYFILNIYK